MRIHHACRDIHNAGDYIGPYLYTTITGRSAKWVQDSKKPHYIICGSIMQDANENSIILGAGFGAEDQILKGAREILIVRGHLTGAMLVEQGYPETWTYGDPGLFLPMVYYPKVEKTKKVGIIPHYIDKPLLADTPHIDICQPVPDVIRDILECEAIISSTLHGLIIAQAYGIPAVWVEFSDGVVGGGFKFRDYFTTVDIDPATRPIDCRSGIPENIVIPAHITPDFTHAFQILESAVNKF